VCVLRRLLRAVLPQVTAAVGSASPLFPSASKHNFCYLTIDPLQRHVKYWYCAFFPMM